MERDARGYFSASVDDVGPGACYRYRLDGEKLRPDPTSHYQPEGVHGPSAVVDPAFSWHDEEWHGLPLERFVTTTTFRTHDDVWNDQRLARRARSLDLPSWLEVVQANIDLYFFGDALRELRDLKKIFPDSSEAKSLADEIDRQRNLR